MDEGTGAWADSRHGTYYAKQQRRDDKADDAGEGHNMPDCAVPSNKELGALRQNIEEIIGSGKSLMPEGLEQKIDKQHMSDLLSYLLSLKK